MNPEIGTTVKFVRAVERYNGLTLAKVGDRGTVEDFSDTYIRVSLDSPVPTQCGMGTRDDYVEWDWNTDTYTDFQRDCVWSDRPL